MPAWLIRLRQRLSRPVIIWAAVTALFSVLVLISLSHLAGVPAQETMRANSEQQRVIIDPATGVVSGMSEVDSKATPFEVAEEEEAAAPTDEEKPVTTEEPETPVVEDSPVDEPAEEPVASSSAGGEGFMPLALTRADPPTPLVPRSGESLVTAPAPEISEKVENELLPMRGEKDASAATLYAKAFIRKDAEQRLVSIVVTDIGFNGEVLTQAIALPSYVTAGISPYADVPADQIGALRNKGHEVWAMLPAMGARYPQDDPGPLGLINALTIKGALTRLHTLMANTLGSVGFILPPDETFSAQKDLWRAVFEDIHGRGLYVLSTHATREAKALTPDKKQQESIRRADLLLDSTPGAAFVRSKLASIRDLAAKQPTLVVLVSARPQSLTLLKEWLDSNPLEGVATFAPLSAIYVPYKEPVQAPEATGGHGEAPKPSEGGH